MHFNYPFKTDNTGHTARVDEERHIRQLIEQILFTSIEERVNRPTFGTRINQLVFAPNSEELTTATTLLVKGALQQWMTNLIKVIEVSTKAQDSRLEVTVQYVLLKNTISDNNGQVRVAQYTRRV